MLSKARVLHTVSTVPNTNSSTPSNPLSETKGIRTLKSVLLIYSNTKAGVFDWKREYECFVSTQTMRSAICFSHNGSFLNPT